MTVVTTAAVSPISRDGELLIELIDLHAQAMRRMPWVQSLLVFGVGLFVFADLPHLLFLGWALLTIAVEASRARFAVGVLRRGNAIDPKRTHAIFVGLAALAGASIGVGAAASFSRIPLRDQALVAVTLFAIPAAGVAVSQSSRYILAAYALFMLVPPALQWALLYPSQAMAGLAMTLLYCGVLILVAADGEKLLARSVRIRHERDQLVRDLEQRNADVRAAMTEVQGAMAQAEQSAQARARVLAAASHDLRQPLHALSVYSAVLASKPAPDLLNEVSSNIDQIVRSLSNLLNGLLDLSRLSSGYYVPERQSVELGTVIAGVCAEFAHAAEQKSVTLVQELEPVRVLGDAVAVGRIGRNLLDNAIKYTEQGTVRVGLRLEAGEAPSVVLTVSDTGKGIPATEHDRIFEEFYQLDNPGRDRSRGVGLGLAIVQRLCELIGARIGVESAVGVGTSFRVSFPAHFPIAPSDDASLTQPAASTLKGKRVYVVDDEIDILKSMTALLRVWGIDVRTADSPSAAERLFEQQGTPDLMIVDLRLREGEHGARLVQRLASQHGDFPVLIITGETASEALRQARDSGHTLLQKPIAPEVLRHAIAAAITSAGASASR